MTSPPIATSERGDAFNNLFQVRGRFLRSAHLERDWNDPEALRGYVLTSHTRESVERLSQGLAPRSGLRAWRITGDYGSGKSSFALLLAHGFSARRAELSPELREMFAHQGQEPQSPYLLPVLVTGAREPLRVGLLRALDVALRDVVGRGRQPRVLGDVQAALQGAANEGETNDAAVLEMLLETRRFVVESGRAEGLLLILDEMGKFLEFAALRPDQQDVFLLQELAEAAARSGPHPLFVVGLLHQGFSAYAEGLASKGQKEWEKIAGRYEELTWNQPIEQGAGLVADALHLRVGNVAPELSHAAGRDMDEALRLRWYGSASADELRELAPRLFPLHPTVLPPLTRAFARFGQNERSLFQFLLGHEPFGLRDFVQRTGGREFFRLPDLWQYIRASFGARLHQQSYRSHWGALESVVSSHHSDDPREQAVLQSVALLNALDMGDLLPTEGVLKLALRGGVQPTHESFQVEQTLRQLHHKHLLHFRGEQGGYSVWPHTSVNLERCYDDAGRALDPIRRVAPLLAGHLETRPLVARRHYIQTGNLRHFEVIYCAVEELQGRCTEQIEINGREADGRIIVPLCETPEEELQALEVARRSDWEGRSDLLIAVPHPLGGLAGALDEARRWDWIERHTPGLEHDRYAREEVSRQKTGANRLLDDAIQNAIGLTKVTGSGLRWFHKGEEKLQVRNGSQVLGFLSLICEERFHNSPRIRNELINRRTLSSAAAGARMRLIERVLETPTLPYLGMDASKKPPEMSMYLSVLRGANLHRETDEGWIVGLPDAEEDRNLGHLRPALDHIREVVAQGNENRVPVTHVFQELRRHPYGVRDGLSPLLLAVFAAVHEQELAFYEDGTFIPRMTGSIFLRLTKAPETFEMQWFPLSGVRAELFQRLVRTLQPGRDVTSRVDVLDVVRPLASFAAALPAYTSQTTRLSAQTQKVRAALVDAREPAPMLFHELPVACGLPPFTADAQEDGDRVEEFAQLLKASIDELRSAYPSLLTWMLSILQGRFGLSGSFGKVQAVLAPRARALSAFAREPRFKSFCLRLADTGLPESQWLESLGSLICAQPPARWRDGDVHKFEMEMNAICSQFARVEATAFSATAWGKRSSDDGDAMRVSLTHQDGEERERIVFLNATERQQSQELESRLAELIQGQGRAGLAAASRVLWRAMEDER